MTYCEDCQHMHPDSRSGPSYRAMCMKFPRIAGAGFVSKQYWDRDPPYGYCREINLGDCPLYEERKDME